MFERIMKNIEWITIPIGGVALILSLFGCDFDYLTGFAGVLCLIYIIYAGYLWVLRPKFDWHLIHGQFLFKVVAFVLLVPSLITSIYLLYNIWSKPGYSPKNLVYDENLYTIEDVEIDTLGAAKNSLSQDLIFIKAHNLETKNDSLIVQKNKLPESIISKQNDPSIFWTVYYHFIDPGNQHMTTSQSGRGWSALIAILGVFLLNGLLVSSIIGWIDSRKEKWLKGEVKYPDFLHKNKHYVIIGGNDMVAGIVNQLLPNGKYILIQTSSDVESFRRELFSTITEEQQKQIIIYYGSRTSSEDIEGLCVECAEEVYIIGEETRTDDIESYHDTMNMKCLDLLLAQYKKTQSGEDITTLLPQVEALKKELSEAKDGNEKIDIRETFENKKLDEKWANRKRLNCRVMFEYQTTFSVFQFFDIDEQMDAYINFIPFNYYEMWAQNVLINRKLDKKQIEDNFKNGGYLPLEGASGIKQNDGNYVHLFIIGMSRMGVAMAIEAAHLAHYPNYEGKKIRTKITFIDKNAAEEKDFFMGRFKELFTLSRWRYGDVCSDSGLIWHMPHVPSGYEYLGNDFIDIEWEFVNGGIESSAIQDYILASANPMAKITIAVCLPESNRSHAVALYLHKKIYESDSVQQVLVYNRYGSSVVGAISSGKSIYPYRGKLRSFGSSAHSIVIEHLEISESVGRFINKAYAGDSKQYAIREDSQYEGKSKVANLWSSIYNGNTLWTKLRCIDFNANTFANNEKDIKILADVEHNRWNVEELLMNFRYLEEEEQIEVINGKKKKKDLKKQMAHLDICSNKKLLNIDSGAHKYDIILTKCLPEIFNQLKVRFPND